MPLSTSTTFYREVDVHIVYKPGGWTVWLVSNGVPMQYNVYGREEV
jgi:hypothetical protein